MRTRKVGAFPPPNFRVHSIRKYRLVHKTSGHLGLGYIIIMYMYIYIHVAQEGLVHSILKLCIYQPFHFTIESDRVMALPGHHTVWCIEAAAVNRSQPMQD